MNETFVGKSRFFFQIFVGSGPETLALGFKVRSGPASCWFFGEGWTLVFFENQEVLSEKYEAQIESLKPKVHQLVVKTRGLGEGW